VPDNSQLPASFPESTAPSAEQVAADIALALQVSPLLAELDWITEQTRVELQNAENSALLKLDALLLASKDVGARASPKGDKSPFELEAGLFGEVPLQRREALGKIQATEAKLAQLNAKRQFIIDKTAAAVRDAISALAAAAGRIERASENVQLARQTFELGRLQFDEGDINLVELNIYEQAVTNAELLLISAEADFFSALADYRAALAVDPFAPDP
jgi:outer membrane protein TolC